MTINSLIPLMLFTFTMSISPGPNNIMVTASGANFGYRKTIPHLLGIWFGFSSIMILSAFGLKQVFDLFPLLKEILKYMGVTYMLFLAWKIARSRGTGSDNKESRPISFFQAALFQIINPKAIMMAVTVMSVYTMEGDMFYLSAFLVIAIFFATGFPSTSAWALFGTYMGKVLKSERNLRIFNFSLAAMTAAAAFALLRSL